MRLLQHLALGLLLIILATHQRAQAQDDFDEDLDLDEMDMADMDDMMVEDVDEESEPPELELKERPVYKPPVAKGPVHFSEAFVSVPDFEKRWVQSQARKDDADDDIAKYDGQWSVEEPGNNPLQGDLGLVLKSRAKHHAISANLDKAFEFSGKPLVVQYEVKFQNGQECGGAYVKLLMKDKKTLDLKKFTDKMGYTIMFGPDKCGNDNKLHFIFRHKNPITGEFEEKHAKKPSGAIDKFFTDKQTHLYTLVVSPDNSFEIYVDQDMVNSGNLLEDMTPSVNPPKEIVDPEDKKPEDWDEREKIPDPDATKPDDWDESEPEYITDPDATKPDGWLDDEAELMPDGDAEKPEDWDDEMDGEWEAPMINNPACESAPGCGEWSAPEIKNPKYKGKWRPPLIDNPDYKGKWTPKMIPNPNFFEDKTPYKMQPIVAIGLELWSMSDNILFDNFIITDNKEVADSYAADSWEQKHFQELSGGGSGKSVVQAVLDATQDRPWLWAVFLIVVVLPIILVIAYCCMPSSKSGFFQRLLDAANERKWLYGIYAGVVLLPVVILSVWLCPNSGLGIKREDIQRIKEEEAKHKKTDEATPADKEEEEEEEESKEGEEEGEEEAEEEEAGSGDSKKSPKKKKASRSDLEAEEENDADAEEAEADSTAKTRTSPRKRKTRKD